jgi:multidrug efflux pump subunit AcrB
MLFVSLCSPALLSIILVFAHVVTETAQEHYKEAMTKLLIGVMFTMLLQLFCLQNMRVIAWLLVFIPMIMYTYTTFIIFFVFGVNPSERVKGYLIN